MMYRNAQALRNEPHDAAFEIPSDGSATPAMDTPAGMMTYQQRRYYQAQQQQQQQRRPKSPTPSTSQNDDDEEEYTATETSMTSSQEQEALEAYYYTKAVADAARKGAPSMRPASPVKQSSLPRAHSSASPTQQQGTHFNANTISPAGAREALRELNQSMDELCDNFNDTSSSTVNSALNEVCDKLELLSEIVLSHERRLKKAEQEQQQNTGFSPASASIRNHNEENKSLVQAILGKVDAVEEMMNQVQAAQQQQQQQIMLNNNTSQVRSPLSNISKENITPARSEASAVIAATVESAMKSISRQLQRQNQLLAQFVNGNSQQRSRPSPMAPTPYSEERDELAESTTASIADEIAGSPELSVRRERTPEALAVTASESARRQLEAMREQTSAGRFHVDPMEAVVPPARLYDEYAYSEEDDYEDEEENYDDDDEEEEEQTETDNISLDNVVEEGEEGDAYYYDRRGKQSRISTSPTYNVPEVGRGADIISVASSEFEEEVAEEGGDNASLRRAMYGAIDSVKEIRAQATSPARNRTVYSTIPPQPVYFDTEEEEETEEDDDMVTDTEDDQEQLQQAQHFSPSRRTPGAYPTTAAEMARRDEEELVATLRAKQATNDYLRSCVGITNSPSRQVQPTQTNSATSSPASRTSTNPATTNRNTANNSLMIEVDPETGLTPQPAYLLRSAIRNDALSAEKLPEKRVLFVDEEVAEDDETEVTDDLPSETEPTPSDMSYTGTTTTSISGQSATTVPNKLLQEVINELAKLRKENASLQSQLEWALRRTDAVSERLLELSPCK